MSHVSHVTCVGAKSLVLGDVFPMLDVASSTSMWNRGTWDVEFSDIDGQMSRNILEEPELKEPEPEKIVGVGLGGLTTF